jgi:hypothetical protein
MPLPVDANSLTRLSWLEDFFSYLITPNIKAQVDGHGELKCHIADTILIKYCRPFQWIWSENADGSGAAQLLPAAIYCNIYQVLCTRAARLISAAPT